VGEVGRQSVSHRWRKYVGSRQLRLKRSVVYGSMQARNDCLAADSIRIEGICRSPGFKKKLVRESHFPHCTSTGKVVTHRNR